MVKKKLKNDMREHFNLQAFFWQINECGLVSHYMYICTLHACIHLLGYIRLRYMNTALNRPGLTRIIASLQKKNNVKAATLLMIMTSVSIIYHSQVRMSLIYLTKLEFADNKTNTSIRYTHYTCTVPELVVVLQQAADWLGVGETSVVDED